EDAADADAAGEPASAPAVHGHSASPLLAVYGSQAVPARTLPCSTDASLRRRARPSTKSACVTDAGAAAFEPVRVIAASAASCASDLRSAGEKLAVRAARSARRHRPWASSPCGGAASPGGRP